jgi:hypothetical protein
VSIGSANWAAVNDRIASSTTITTASASATGLPAASVTAIASCALSPGPSLAALGVTLTLSARCLGGTGRSIVPTA